MDLPLYLRISERLTRDIAAGNIEDGSRLPPEVEMARSLGVSVGTLRKALGELAARGLLTKRHGSGNYVRRSDDPAGIYAFFHLELSGGGGLPGARALSADKLAPPHGADVSWPEAWRLRRVRTLNGVAVGLEEIWIDARHAEAIDAATLPESLYRHYAAAFGFVIERVEDQVGTGFAPHWTPPEFPIATGSVCGFVGRRAASRSARLAEISLTWFDASRVTYVARWSESAR